MTKLSLIVFLLFSNILIARSPAVEELKKLNQEQIDREDRGQSYSGQYQALKGQSLEKKSQRQLNFLYSFLILTFVFALLPMGVWQIMKQYDGQQLENAENVYQFEKSSYSKFDEMPDFHEKLPIDENDNNHDRAA